MESSASVSAMASTAVMGTLLGRGKPSGLSAERGMLSGVMEPGAPLRSVARLETMPHRHLDATARVDRGMLDEGDKVARHASAVRTGCPVRVTSRTSTAPREVTTDATTGARGDDLEGLDALPGVDHRFDTATPHGANDTPDSGRPPSPPGTARRSVDRWGHFGFRDECSRRWRR
jgi:hypothetical protein